MKKDVKSEIIRNGFIDKYIEQLWKSDTEKDIRRKMIIVAKGKRIAEAIRMYKTGSLL